MAKHQRATFLAIGSGLLAVAPKCPICFLAYFGIFGVATASASVYRAWLPPLTAIWLILTVAMLAFGRDSGRKAGPVVLGVIAGIGVFAGRFTIHDQRVVFAGVAGLVVATVWRSWVRKRNTLCDECDARPESPRPQLMLTQKPHVRY